MKKLIFVLLALVMTSSLFAQRGRRPNYGGGYHTKSHGGSYPGSTNSHHKGGHYVNPNSDNLYGTHKTTRRRKY